MSDKRQAILFIILAGLGFSLMSFFIKLSGDIPTYQKAFFRNLVAGVLAFSLLFKGKVKVRLNKTNAIDLFMRSFFGTLGLLCNFYAIDKINISDANILNKLSPFFAMILSYFILKEKASKKEWLALIVAFIGAVFVVKPSMNSSFLNSMIGMFSGFCAGLAYTYVRKMGKYHLDHRIIVSSFSLISCVLLFPGAIFYGVHLSVYQLSMLVLAGLCATLGQFSITLAYSKAPAKEISVFDYSQVLFAAVLGLLFLGQIPDKFSIIGYIIIVGTAVYKWQIGKHSDVEITCDEKTDKVKGDS